MNKSAKCLTLSTCKAWQKKATLMAAQGYPALFLATWRAHRILSKCQQTNLASVAMQRDEQAALWSQEHAPAAPRPLRPWTEPRVACSSPAPLGPAPLLLLEPSPEDAPAAIASIGASAPAEPPGLSFSGLLLQLPLLQLLAALVSSDRKLPKVLLPTLVP